ncbi:MAG: hypothetical protein Q8N77_02245 [Nanoarchaeota archaeon]|nr:hypothetical protein [Nanoarchaeota archaeon]
MKIPNIFVPCKNPEEKMEQLLAGPKQGAESLEAIEKEKMVEDILQGLNNEPNKRPHDLYDKIKSALSQEGYSKLSQKDVSNKLWPYMTLYDHWVRKEGTSTDVFLRKATIKDGEYVFAKVKPESLEEFCLRFAKHEEGELNKSAGRYHHRSNCIKGFIAGGLVSGALTILELYSPSTTTVSPTLVAIAAPLLALAVGGACSLFFDVSAHKINETRMRDLCYILAYDEKEAVRFAIY